MALFVLLSPIFLVFLFFNISLGFFFVFSFFLLSLIGTFFPKTGSYYFSLSFSKIKFPNTLISRNSTNY
ncbi:hypothetical protein Lalb_Chr14g0374141 [Lupinus albus]|uniref:Uncharacterized protein n=1 Tax=Lupinus albus TaxID=3870 RepID=A0A6A4PGF1_LUPAL|nr:hypothetical protein Lalb_Chr14g0374141 [Lupinus albus]